MNEPRPWMSAGRPHTVAHRGARSLAPENTLAAFRKAAGLGAAAVECDVQLTRDGVPVVFHDYTLERCTDWIERVREAGAPRSPLLADWSLAELRELDAGAWYARKDPFGQVRAGALDEAELRAFDGLRIPTLAELVELCAGTGLRLVLELKQSARPSAELVRRSLEVVREGGLLGSAVVISFDHPSLLEAKRLEPSVATGALLVSRLAGPGRYARDVLGAEMVSVYCPERVFARTAPGQSYLAEDAAEAHEAGVAYHVWTVNAASDFPGLVEAGIDGIGTDFPQHLLAYLRGEGLPAEPQPAGPSALE
jgi:glycerophosphoryl diester phosphodiesterase